MKKALTMDRVVLYDQKRLKLLQRAWLFNWVPFVKKVYIAGSMALGNVHENSDFDVIVVAEPGRLYTARSSCLLLFGLMGWRRTLEHPKDGFCFNTFTTKSTETTSSVEVIKDSGSQLYCSLLSQEMVELDINPLKSLRLVNVVFGYLEPILKRWQTLRIERFLKKFPPHTNSRIIYNDERVELCLNLKKW